VKHWNSFTVICWWSEYLRSIIQM